VLVCRDVGVTLLQRFRRRPFAPSYQLSFNFNYPEGCLWAVDAAALDQFGYDACEDQLPLSTETRNALDELRTWRHAETDPTAPPDRRYRWTAEEYDRFNAAAAGLLPGIRRDLGARFSVEHSRLAGPPYHLRFAFNHLEGCLEAANDAATERFGYGAGCEEQLPLSKETRAGLDALCEWHQFEMDLDAPPDRRHPWTDEEYERLNAAAMEILPSIRRDLGASFVVEYDPVAHPDRG
jgi:hypothetical protein